MPQESRDAVDTVQTAEEVFAQLASEGRTVVLSSFPDLTMRKPMSINVVCNGDDFVATFFDAAISATGDTVEEAVWNLQDITSLKFRRFSSLPSTSLGKIPSRQLAVLREFGQCPKSYDDWINVLKEKNIIAAPDVENRTEPPTEVGDVNP